MNNGSEKAIIGIRSHGIGPRFFAIITTGEPKPQPRRKRPTKVNVMSISYSDGGSDGLDFVFMAVMTVFITLPLYGALGREAATNSDASESE